MGITLITCNDFVVVRIIDIPNVIPVSATRWGRQRRLARTISSIASRSGREQNRPVYRYSSTALIQLRVVLGNSTLETGTCDTAWLNCPRLLLCFAFNRTARGNPKWSSVSVLFCFSCSSKVNKKEKPCDVKADNWSLHLKIALTSHLI